MKAGLQRRLATGVNAVLVGLFVVAITALVVDLAGRYHSRVDLSVDGVATLDRDTLDALAEVDANDGTVEVIATSHQRRQADNRFKDRRIQDLLRELKDNSRNLRTTFIDLDRERQLAESLQISSYGTLAVRTAEHRVDFKTREVFRRNGPPDRDGNPDLEFRGEGLVARGIQQVLSGQARKIYVLQGHGEPSRSDPSPEGVGRLSEVMDRQGWDVRDLDLLRDRDQAGAPEIPDDADAVLIIAPRTSLDPSEEAALREFLHRGGGIGVWLEPGLPVPEIVGTLGIGIPEGVAYDRPSLVPYDDWWLPQYGRHSIVEELSEDEIKTVFGRGVAIRFEKRVGVEPSLLLRSSNRGWLERVAERPPADLDPGVDDPGPVDVAIAMNVEPASGVVGQSARMVVVGDSTLVSNELMDRLGNPTFAVNTVRWLVRDDERMTLVGQPGRQRRIQASPEALSTIGWLVIGVWPMLVVLLGGIVWWTRRGR
jgi:hypothetical protein